MKLPKKLDMTLDSKTQDWMYPVSQIAFKVNQIIDYLSDKEKCKYCKVGNWVVVDGDNCSHCGRDVVNGEEASKGGCKHQRQYSVGSDDWKCADCGKDCPKHQAHPPQQEESPKASDNPWLDKAHKMRLQAEEIMDKVNARINESPKEDEWKELSDLIHDAIYGGEVRGVDVIQRVNEKFILKSKVNKAIDGRLFIRPELDEFEKGCNMASRGIRRSLGLEEL